MSGAAEAMKDDSSGTHGVQRGRILGGTYELQKLIGRGGMAEIYAARHSRLGRTFAVKVLRAESSSKMMERFRREARALARIRNDFVIDVIDCGETDGTPYLVMELLSGGDLRALIDESSPLPIRRAVHLVWEACQGVAAVHRAGLVHRDLKPENLFLTKRSTGEDWCKVLDFGIAKMDLSGATVDGALIGTVRYMAPEQLQDGASTGPPGDIYSLGAVLYELLSGVSPHTALTAQELMFKVLNVEPMRLDERRREVPSALADAVHRALAKAAGSRFSNVQEFARAIAPFARSGPMPLLTARSETVDLESVPGARSDAARPRFRTLALGAVAAASIAAGGFILGQSGRPPSAVPAVASLAPVPVPKAVAALPVRSKESAPTATAVAPPPSSAQVVAPVPTHSKPQVAQVATSALRRRFDNANPYPR